MDEFFRGFWDFAGSYWWLAFPLFGAIGAIGTLWNAPRSGGTSADWRPFGPKVR